MALAANAIQLVLNGLWSATFFGLRLMDWVLMEFVCMWLAVLATVAPIHDVIPTTAVLLVPYAFWVGFAVILNYRIRCLNLTAPASS